MHWNNPGAIPGLDPNPGRGSRTNPPGTIPGPAPEHAVPGQYTGAVQLLTWTLGPGALPNGANGSNIVRQAVWRSPIFDLRPVLRGAQGQQPTRSHPIWVSNGSGSGGALLVKLFGLAAAPNTLTGLRLTASEYADPSSDSAGEMTLIGAPQDLTGDIFPGQPSALLRFVPPGEGYPTRFWQGQLVFDYYTDNGANPGISLKCTYY